MGKKLKTFFARCVAREKIHPLHTSSLYGRGFPSAFCLLPSAFLDAIAQMRFWKKAIALA
ncbi:hypothetical protein [Nostoc sp.]|uniref:hypothetical protein n=1 Tax=Nostoc sp. TaxID=1180 RepID=UPI002FF51003